MKVTRKCVGHVVGQSCNVVESGDVSIIPLMHAEEADEVCRRGVGGGYAFALPERCVEVVALTDDGTFTHFKGLDEGLQVNEAAGYLEVGIGDGPLWAEGSD